MNYVEVVQSIIAEDGLGGLFFRGLQTRLLTNALQGMLFLLRRSQAPPWPTKAFKRALKSLSKTYKSPLKVL